MDAEEIARLVKDLRVSSDTNAKAVIITEDEAQKGLKRLANVVVGKIFSRRVLTREMLRSNLPRILRARGSTEVEVVGCNLFVISFSLESDKKVALEEGPWQFFQDLMILKQSQAMQTPNEVDFDEISLWVQCHNVPYECMTPSIIERIGGQVGKVEEIDVGEGGTCVGKFARVRVTRPISDPLVRCVPLKREGSDNDVIVILQYEKLPDFCFLCGRLGHISRDCMVHVGDKDKPRFDSWLRAGRSFVGRREIDTGGRVRSGPSGSGGSAQRWVAIHPNVRVEEVVHDKEEVGVEGSNVGSGEVVGEGNGVDMEVISTGGALDVSLLEGAGVPGSLTVGSGVGVLREPGCCEGREGLGVPKLGKGNAKGLEGSSATKLGGKKWKRLAREPGGGMREAGDKGVGRLEERRGPKKRGTLLRDEEEGEEETSVQKKRKEDVAESGDMFAESTAAAAVQPRRAL